MGTATQTLACTVESSLFVGDQFSWLSWITVHEFTSPRTLYNHYLLKVSQLHNQLNYVPTKQETPLLPMNTDPPQI